MEGAIKTVVMQFLSAARGKENLSGKSFQKLVQGQLGNIMSVSSPHICLKHSFYCSHWFRLNVRIKSQYRSWPGCNCDAVSCQLLRMSQSLSLYQDTDSSSAVKDMMKGLDDNQDGKVSFQEYMTLIGYVASSVSEQKGQANAAGGQ